MHATTRVSLDQWRALVAVVDHGGYAQAATALHKTQSSVTYAVQRIGALLDMQLFKREGRRAVLTEAGRALYRRARMLLDDAGKLEHFGRLLQSGWEAEIRIGVEILFPIDWLLQALQAFAAESPQTRIEVIDTVMGGGREALLARTVDIAILPDVPAGFLGDPLLDVELLAVARADHLLHRLGRPLDARDLQAARHLLVRDSGTRRDDAAVTVNVAQRWVFSGIIGSLEAVRAGAGFAWLPQHLVADDLASGRLRPLPLPSGSTHRITLYMVLTDGAAVGPGVQRLAALLRDQVSGVTPT
ncbi:MAG: LysR family transcriptional regulator [Rhodocyclaceae bacterium]|nr:LysR family transcriptional regulator [Rhodocyclaceae bacterium]